jgi:NAD(P)-dependent dehydrogenase (short-subunit alcohol dehydrogenase family)
MATSYWILGAIALLVVALTWAIPVILADVFPYQMLRAHRVGKPTVNTKSYQGRTVLITGAHGAFGSRAAKLIARRDVETLVLVDMLDCSDIKKQIEDELAGEKEMPQILVWQVDMMSYKSCQELAKKARTLKSLDHALMTAGILSFNRRESPEGWETCEHINFGG